MRFESVNISSLGPFSENQILRFHANVNLIQGSNGTGKTTIFRELLRQYREQYRRSDIPVELAIKLVFIGESYGHEERRGQSIVVAAHKLQAVQCLHLLPKLIAHRVNQLIARKVMWGHSKFGQPEDSGYPFAVAISEEGALEIFGASGSRSDSLFVAAGESLMLSLACNFALRDLLEFGDPFVIDGAFDLLDESLLPAFYQETFRMNNQRIYLLSERISERMGADPDYVLVWDDDKVRILAVATHA
jgi:hypothetical protein